MAAGSSRLDILVEYCLQKSLLTRWLLSRPTIEATICQAFRSGAYSRDNSRTECLYQFPIDQRVLPLLCLLIVLSPLSTFPTLVKNDGVS